MGFGHGGSASISSATRSSASPKYAEGAANTPRRAKSRVFLAAASGWVQPVTESSQLQIHENTPTLHWDERYTYRT